MEVVLAGVLRVLVDALLLMAADFRQRSARSGVRIRRLAIFQYKNLFHQPWK
jgi:hypothetical protein